MAVCGVETSPFVTVYQELATIPRGHWAHGVKWGEEMRWSLKGRARVNLLITETLLVLQNEVPNHHSLCFPFTYPHHELTPLNFPWLEQLSNREAFLTAASCIVPTAWVPSPCVSIFDEQTAAGLFVSQLNDTVQPCSLQETSTGCQGWKAWKSRWLPCSELLYLTNTSHGKENQKWDFWLVQTI